jgi:hypothetical protein
MMCKANYAADVCPIMPWMIRRARAKLAAMRAKSRIDASYRGWIGKARVDRRLAA